ncbi:hypothetical protein [Bacillus suaedae]|nr:hypothetical protein [Bacillus suaedae]
MNYSYKPPKVKASTKLVDVIDENEEFVCNFKRSYKNPFIRLADFFLDHNFFVQIDVFTENGKLKYQGKKIPRWGKTQYKIVNYDTQEEYHISYVSWQTINPELLIKSKFGEFIVKKDLVDWARCYYEGVEIARWKMKTTELFKTYLEIECHSPIKEPEFFVCLFQCVFYIGD